MATRTRKDVKHMITTMVGSKAEQGENEGKNSTKMKYE